MLRDRFGVSERRACTVAGIHRSTMRLAPPPLSTEEAELRGWLRTFSTDRPRWGSRRAATMARRAGWTVNNKRIRDYGARKACGSHSAASLFIDPGSPWQNAWIGSFNGRLRDELFNAWRFDSLLEARVIIEDWRCDDNANRPHTAHGQLTPTEFALQWTTTHQPQVA